MKQASTNTGAVETFGSVECHRKVRVSDCQKCRVMWNLRQAKLPVPSIKAILGRMRHGHTYKRQVLYAEGDEATCTFAIRSGRVKLANRSPSGREHVTAVLRPGDIFGLEAMFDIVYSNNAEALGDCELCLITREDLVQLVAENPGLTGDLARYVFHNLSRTRQSHLSLMAAGSASERFAAYLLQNLPHDSADASEPSVPNDLTLKELGSILGIKLETVCRVRRDLTDRGIIEVQPDIVLIRDLGSLRDLAAI